MKVLWRFKYGETGQVLHKRLKPISPEAQSEAQSELWRGIRTVSHIGASCEKPGGKTHVQREKEKWKTVKEVCSSSDVGSECEFRKEFYSSLYACFL